MYNRNLRKPNPTKNVFKFSSQKNREMVLCEGSLEFDACFHFEYSKDVLSFTSQPTGFYYHFCEKQNPYTPDFLVHYRDGSHQFWEVKPRAKAQNSSFRAKFEARQRAAKELGETVCLVTERQIRLNPLLNN
uniref:TnsA endonuclease N-terminal domain-containing protein n=1 Tax=Thaumasiovibrio occultus TaxID=1891184 RepID=UPI00131A688B|nr:TnsA endonuclease N-terminal domain-containing protein [Thaumasiovibrio occultus]